MTNPRDNRRRKRKAARKVERWRWLRRLTRSFDAIVFSSSDDGVVLCYFDTSTCIPMQVDGGTIDYDFNACGVLEL